MLEPYPAHMGMVWFLLLLQMFWEILSLKELMDSLVSTGVGSCFPCLQGQHFPHCDITEDLSELLVHGQVRDSNIKWRCCCVMM